MTMCESPLPHEESSVKEDLSCSVNPTLDAEDTDCKSLQDASTAMVTPELKASSFCKIQLPTSIAKMMSAKTSSKSVFSKAAAPAQDPAPAQKIYYCDKCDKVFTCSQQLGGHKSRMHQGQSEAYQMKL